MNKKIAVILFVVFLFSLTACGKSEFELAINNTKNLESVKFEMTTTLGYVGSYKAYYELDGYKTKVTVTNVGTVYSEYIDGVLYTYVMQLDETYHVSQENVSEYTNILPDFDLFESNLFEQNGDYYDAIDSIEEFDNLRIKISNGYITYISYNFTEDGLTYEVVYNLSNFNQVEVIIPEVE